MRYRLIIMISALLLILSSNLSFAADKSGKYVFVQTGERINIAHVKKNPNLFKMIIYKAHPKVVFFSDQPKRDYGTIANTQFVKNWKLADRYFQKNPPNVLINYYDPSKKMNHEIKTGILVLSNPAYDQKTHTVSYNAKQIAGTPMKNIYHYYPVVFIDDPKGNFHNCVRAMHCPLNT